VVAGLAVALALPLAGAAPGAGPTPVRFLSYADVQALPRVDSLDALAGVPAAGRPAAWDAWVRTRAADIAARIQRGEEDSLAYLLMFGTGYTKAPRMTREFFDRAGTNPPAAGVPGPGAQPGLARAFETRLDDLLRALESPGSNERLSWAAATLARLGYRFGPPDGRARAGEYLLRNLSRVIQESTRLSQALQAAERAGDRNSELAQRARLFADRGLAPDTSWTINSALAGALGALKDSSTIAIGTVRRVAIVGPGLDFADKAEGHDYYPLQSLQPFAVIDTLLASGLAPAAGPQVMTIDVSPRVNGYLRRLTGPSGRRPFDLQLVRDRLIRWTPDATQYWNAFGAAIGSGISPIPPPPSAGELDTRAIRVTPKFLRSVMPIDADIVYQRVAVPDAERCDLVIATNVLLYYGTFEQMLAVLNITAMLAPGGLLLTNTRLDDLPALSLQKVTETATAFSDRPGDGEYVFVYRKPR
jgi:hypothetical protein